MINKLAEVLNQIESTFGTQQCLDHCEAVYSGVYRSESTFTFFDMLDEEMQDSMINHVMSYLAVKAGKYQYPPVVQVGSCFAMDDDYDYIDDPSEVLEQFRQQATELVLSGIPFVDICNYKGEGEGFALLEEVKHKQIYVSKYNYI